MALRIYNNISSLNAQRYLGITNSQMSKSLERLSSGLRINHAADDASGLAISEKLRGQISGLKRASMNAQDGISMLQTAEGGLQEIQSIVQRMRELAVQASNGTYTANDRAELQKEMEQLKGEINRISASTEFNTKKLLNGDASALWSASSNKLEAIIKGKVDQGEYTISATATAGKNYIYKTDIMTLAHDVEKVTITNDDNNQIKSIKNLSSNFITTDSSGNNIQYNITLTDGTSTVNNTTTSTVDYFTTNSTSSSISTVTGEVTTALNNVAGPAGYFEIEINNDYDGSAINGTINGFATLKVYSLDGKLQGTADLNLTGDGTNNTLYLSPLSLYGYDLTSATSTTIDLTGDALLKGDKAVFAINQVTAGEDAIQITNPNAINTSNPTLSVSFANSSNLSQTFALINYTNDGQTHIQTFDLTLDSNGITTDDNDIYFTVDKLGVAGDIATADTKLKDIARFINADGRNIFDNTQELTIFGNGKSTTIYLEGDDTLSDFESKLEDALVNDLGMGDASVKNDLVYYDTTTGTFKIQSGLIGEDSKISFIGDQKLIDGLSLTTIQKGENSSLTITVTDSNNNTVGSDTVNDYTLRGVINGVEISFDKNLGVSVSGDNAGNLTFTASTSATTINLHLVDNSTSLQIGANEGQDINVNIAQINTKSLDLDNVLVVDQDSAQKAITKLDKALEFVSDARATIGAQINRLEHAITNLDTARENLTASESRIRDLDIAEEMANFTRQQILQQAGTAMLAQANQLPQLALQLLGR
ncbi:flagellin [Deferribacter autotrophicus]|uniref:Flagellin n=1 Tax=Deferribacter autotrophicus TaxID=500465 RepID=A0A5A8F8N5_9BACT|nr:flagellin [Deferribacter autotrophicus]KAA0258782.1 flagellin [Deferribacter autotrophicus]